MKILLELDSILHALLLAFCHALTLKKFPFVSVMGLTLHAFCVPIFSHELLSAAAGSTALTDRKNSCTGSDQKRSSSSAPSLQLMPDAWGGKYRSAFNSKVIIVVL